MTAKILIVEDNPKDRDMLSRRLTKRGYEIVLAEDGQEGIDVTMSEMPDLILLDISLPVIDGWGVAKRLKGVDATRDIPIIALTAHALAGDREKSLEAGCDEYATKPVRLPELLEKIEMLLNS
jgi:CheY-like chemotaxis protein